MRKQWSDIDDRQCLRAHAQLVGAHSAREAIQMRADSRLGAVDFILHDFGEPTRGMRVMDGNAAIKSHQGASNVTVKPTGPLLGAEISGVDLTRPLSPEEVAAIHAALLKHKVIFF